MASTGAIFSSKYHTKQPNLWLTSRSYMVIYSLLSDCPGQMEPFHDHPASMTSLTNKPQLKQPELLSAYSYTCLNC